MYNPISSDVKSHSDIYASRFPYYIQIMPFVLLRLNNSPNYKLANKSKKIENINTLLSVLSLFFN